METVKLSTKGQIVIPKSIRDARNLLFGTELAISLVGDEIRIRAAETIVPSNFDAIAGCLHRPDRRRLSDREAK